MLPFREDNAHPARQKLYRTPCELVIDPCEVKNSSWHNDPIGLQSIFQRRSRLCGSRCAHSKSPAVPTEPATQSGILQLDRSLEALFEAEGLAHGIEVD